MQHFWIVLLGDVICNLFYLLPLPDVVAALQTRRLPTTPYFYSCAVFNTSIWTIYGFLTADPFIIAADFMGLSLTFFYFNVALSVTDATPSLLVWNNMQLLAILLGSLYTLQYRLSFQYTFALMGDFWSFMMLWSPVIDVYWAIKKTDRTLIYWPIGVLTVINSGIWVMYGLWLGQWYIWLPSVLTAMSGVIQVSTYYWLAHIPFYPLQAGTSTIGALC